MIKQFLIIGFLFIAAVVIAQQSDNLTGLLPEPGRVVGWTVKDQSEIFNGDDLFLYINGGADIYLEYGFSQVVNIRYQNATADKIHLEIYEMSDPGAAYGIFTLNSSGKGIEENIGDAGMLYDYYLHFVKDKCYVRITTSRKEDANLKTIHDIAAIVEKNITKQGEKPALIKAFELDGKDLKKVKYIRGQIALGNIYNFGHGSVAGFSEGATANFDGKMVFVFAYKNELEGREWFASLKGKMHMNKKFTDYTSVEDGLTVIDKAGNYLSFKPYGKYYMAIKGLNWKESGPVFDEIMGNLDDIAK